MHLTSEPPHLSPAESRQPVLIGIDWGSSSLRVALLDADGAMIDRRESSAGVFTIKDGNFSAALLALCSDWLAQYGVPMLASGMIGSRQGIIEAPYVTCPASASDLARQLARVELPLSGVSKSDPSVALFIVPGLNTGSPATGWDVLRGEETQLFGMPPGAARLYVLPGTHSKWMNYTQSGQVESFQTYMTGELYELMCTHSSLGRVMAPAQWSIDVFQQGVAEARSNALEDLLFKVRTAGLMGIFQPHELPEYLSGLLIGAEIKAGLALFAPVDSSVPVPLLGSAQLTQRYAIAFAQFEQSTIEKSGDAVFNGLLTIARAAGLLDRAEASS